LVIMTPSTSLSNSLSHDPLWWLCTGLPFFLGYLMTSSFGLALAYPGLSYDPFCWFRPGLPLSLGCLMNPAIVLALANPWLSHNPFCWFSPGLPLVFAKPLLVASPWPTLGYLIIPSIGLALVYP